MSKKHLEAAFAKTVITEDGGREVWGFATLERVDKSNEIADFNGTVKAFEKWAEETEKRTGGKSKGNVRLMHQPIAVGKTIHWEPSETTIDVDGKEEVVKGIWVGAYVPPTKPEVIKDIDEGILSAFSIGGAYEKRWWDKDSQAFRYIPSLSEYSLVDNPCCEGADIVNVISKADAGPWNNPDVEKGMDAAGTLEEFKSMISEALYACDCLRGQYGYTDFYTVATYPDRVVIYDFCQSKYLELSYSIDADGVKLGAPVEVALTYIPLDAKQAVDAEKASRNELASSSNSKGGEDIKKGEKELKEGETNTMNLEQIKKAAEATGLSIEQVQKFFEALGKADVDAPPASIGVPVVDGDGDDDNNKEFPNPPSGDEKINIDGEISAVKDAEGEVGVKMDPAPNVPIDLHETAKADGSEDLQKAGASVSKKNGIELQHAANHIGAVMKGTQYTADEHATVEANYGQGNTGEEAPDVEKVFGSIFNPIIETAVAKAVEAVVAKAVEASMQKSAGSEEITGKMESLVKGLASEDGLKKAMDEIEAIKALVKEIHETPQAGGPALNGAGAIMAKGFEMNKPTDETSVKKFLDNISDRELKDKVGQEFAIMQAKNLFR